MQYNAIVRKNKHFRLADLFYCSTNVTKVFLYGILNSGISKCGHELLYQQVSDNENLRVAVLGSSLEGQHSRSRSF